MASRRALICFIIAIAGAALGAGVVIGYFSASSKGGAQSIKFTSTSCSLNCNTVKNSHTPSSGMKKEDVSDKLIKEINPENIRRHLKHLTSNPHLAGTDADLIQAQEMKNFWEDQGMNPVKLLPYEVLLSYPCSRNPNKIELLDGNESILFMSQIKEKIIRPEQNQSDVVPPFNAYSPPGTPKGDLVYVNYARIEDFIWLNKNKSIDLRGKIGIARYGKIFRGSKVNNAAIYGMIGLIMYSDPADYALDGVNDVYPDSWWLPETGVQRGSIKLIKGDPLTPGYPSIESAYRLSQRDAELPRIPAHPIGYHDAQYLLQNMTGEEVPVEWRGDLPTTYRFGPGFINPDWKVQMKISTHNVRKTVNNVHGFFRGEEEPDRYVILGNHRDAWVFGAVDPSSGTAAMMELSRAMGKLIREGWRPRRTIIFCSWAAEEYGMIGSEEWVDYFQKNLGNRAVAYLNVDVAVWGNYTLFGAALPMLNKLMYESATKIPNPSPMEVSAGRKTVYDTWLMDDPVEHHPGHYVPNIHILGSTSDFVPFVNMIGISSVDISYTYSKKLKLSSYPLYHTAYDSFHFVETYMDQDFKCHTAVAQIWGELARSLADSIIPFDVTEYAESIYSSLELIIERKEYGLLMKQHGLERQLEYLRQAGQKLRAAAKAFEEDLGKLDKTNYWKARQVNDQMMQFERAFIDVNGIPDRDIYQRNVVVALSKYDQYSGSMFPGLVDSLYSVGYAGNSTARWEVVKKQLAAITFIIEAAATTLTDVAAF